MDVLLLITLPIFTLILAYIIAKYIINRDTLSSNNNNSKIKEDNASSKDKDFSIKILYASQTGTAEKYSKQLKTSLNNSYGEHIQVSIEDIEEYDYTNQLEKENYVIFCVATYGDGEPPDTGIEFDAWMNDVVKDESSNSKLKNMKFAVFALGNTEYEHFCAFGIKVEKVMKQLGATIFSDRVNGDDSLCIEDDYTVFKAQVLSAIGVETGLIDKNKISSTTPINKTNVPSYLISYNQESINKNGAIKARLSVLSQYHNIMPQPIYIGCLSNTRELHSELSERSCIHGEFDISMTDASYETGDHMAIMPENNFNVVSEAADVLGVSLDTAFTLEIPDDDNQMNLEMPFPGPISLKDALTYYSDITSPPEKSALKMLSAFTEDPKESKKLLFLSSPEGKEEYRKEITDKKLSIIEIIKEYKTCKPPLEAFFACLCQRLHPRYYSISSSPLANSKKISVTVAVVKEMKPSGKEYNGVCSGWLKNVKEGSPALIHVRRSHFKLPEDPKIPIVMVGPGTGLAPFRGFLEHRSKLNSQGMTLGNALLFFGCRNRAKDYIYQDELEGYLNDGVLTGLHVAFSRESSQKEYVQNKLLASSSEVWSLLGENKGYFYVCGEAARMAKDVHKALHDVIQHAAKVSLPQAENIIKEMQEQGRYQKDIW